MNTLFDAGLDDLPGQTRFDWEEDQNCIPVTVSLEPPTVPCDTSAAEHARFLGCDYGASPAFMEAVYRKRFDRWLDSQPAEHREELRSVFEAELKGARGRRRNRAN